jgi:hypothetical protein
VLGTLVRGALLAVPLVLVRANPALLAAGLGVALVAVLAARPAATTPSQASPTAASRGQQPSAAALEALDVRFARGEVDEETYRRSRDLLTRPPGW